MKQLMFILVILLSSSAAVAEKGSTGLTPALAIDELEYRLQDGQDFYAWSGSLSIGAGRRRLWLVSEGERVDGSTAANELRGYYSHPFSENWNVMMGWRGDTESDPDRNWGLLGVEGDAPFGIESTVYAFMRSGRTTMRVEAARPISLSESLSLVPEMTANFHSDDNREEDLGSGLSNLEFAARLAYAIAPNAAIYTGVIWDNTYGDTRDFLDAAGEDTDVFQVLLGLSFSF